MDALQAGVAAMGMFYPARDVTNAQSNWDSVIRLIAKLPTVVAAFHRLRNGDEAHRSRATTSTTPPTSTRCSSSASRRRPCARCSTPA